MGLILNKNPYFTLDLLLQLAMAKPYLPAKFSPIFYPPAFFLVVPSFANKGKTKSKPHIPNCLHKPNTNITPQKSLFTFYLYLGFPFPLQLFSNMRSVIIDFLCYSSFPCLSLFSTKLN